MTTKLLSVTTLFLLFSSSAFAVQPLRADQLQEACDSDINLCGVYVSAFLDGAVATDPRVAEQILSEFEEKESYSERAIRTRVMNRLKRSGPSVYAGFCVGEPVPVADVVDRVQQKLAEYDSLEGLTAKKVVYAALRKHFPCKKD